MSAQPAATAPPAGMPQDEQALWLACRGPHGAAARDVLFSRYLPVARRIAWRFRRDGSAGTVEFSELVQLASVGLLEAIERYRPELGVPFRYFCTRRVAGAITDGIGKLSEVDAQIAVRRRIERERLRSLRRDRPAPRSLDEKLAMIGDIAAELALALMLEDSTMVRNEEGDSAPDAYDTLVWKQAVQQLAAALDGLPDRERGIIRYHYLEGVPFDQIARLLGVTKGRISQIHKSALGLLRKRLSDMARFRVEG